MPLTPRPFCLYCFKPTLTLASITVIGFGPYDYTQLREDMVDDALGRRTNYVGIVVTSRMDLESVD